MKHLFLLLSFLLLSSSAFSQKFKISGTIDGVSKDTLLLWYRIYSPERVDVNKKIPVRNGKFKFSTKLKGYACPASLTLKSRPHAELYFEIVPNEEAVINGPIDSRGKEHWSGSLYYQQYENNKQFVTTQNKEYEPLRAEKKRLIEGGMPTEEADSIMKPKFRALTKILNDSTYKYIEEHANEDATATMAVCCGFDYIMEVINRLSPEVRNGRMKYIVDSKVDFYEHYRQVMARKNASNIVGTDTIGIGYEMPELGLKDLNGNVLSFQSLRGKYVLLDFWGSWCKWCIKEFPEMEKIYKKHRDRLEIVGIDCEDSEAKWKAAVEKHQIPWLHVRSEDGVPERKFKLNGYPFKVIISPEGKILYADCGSSDEDFYNYLTDLLKK